MRLFIVNLRRPDHSFEVLEYRAEDKFALLRGRDDVYKDINFDLAMIKRFYRLTQDVPKWIEDQDHAKLTGLQTGLQAGEEDFGFARRETGSGSAQPRPPRDVEQGHGEAGTGCRSQEGTVEGW